MAFSSPIAIATAKAMNGASLLIACRMWIVCCCMDAMCFERKIRCFFCIYVLFLLLFEVFFL